MLGDELMNEFHDALVGDCPHGPTFMQREKGESIAVSAVKGFQNTLNAGMRRMPRNGMVPMDNHGHAHDHDDCCPDF